MITSARRILGFAIIICSAAIADGALAHPHIWVTLKSELVYAPDGSATGVRHHLTFDDMYLAFAPNKVHGEMSMKIVGSPLQLANPVIIVAVILLAAGIADCAWAQGSPFGDPRPPSAPPAAPVGGLVGWVLAKQAEFYRQFSGLIRAAKADGSAAWTLMGLSFLYGVFHAAGPGHGKAVISSYLVANEKTCVRGVVLSLASALLQAVVAVAIVWVATALLNATASTMNKAVNVIETASCGLIVLIGARLLWVKGRAFVAALRELQRLRGALSAAATRADHLHDYGSRDAPVMPIVTTPITTTAMTVI